MTRSRLTAASPALLLAVPALLAGLHRERRPRDEPATRARSRSSSTDDACDALGDRGARRHAHASTSPTTARQVTEFYLLGEDGLRIVGEVENIGPGLDPRARRQRARPGNYVTACKPGMIGDGIRADFTVTESDEDGRGRHADDQELVDQATRQLRGVRRGPDRPAGRARPQEFVAALQGRRRRRGPRALPRRAHALGADRAGRRVLRRPRPEIDPREADLEPGQEWTGWHRIEKDLWPAAPRTTGADRGGARDLRRRPAGRHRRRWTTRIAELDFTVDQIGNGAEELLDEVATGKVTGEEEIWSHTDLWDFQANVDGARVGSRASSRSSSRTTPSWPTSSTTGSPSSRRCSTSSATGDGFVYYDELTRTRSRSSPTRSTRCPSRCRSSPRRCCADR